MSVIVSFSYLSSFFFTLNTLIHYHTNTNSYIQRKERENLPRQNTASSTLHTRNPGGN